MHYSIIGLSLEISPKQPVALNNRGNALIDLKRPAEALASFDQAIALNPPGYAETYCNRGNALIDLKRPAEALASYDQAIALNPGYAEAYYNRGLVLNGLKRSDEALASYDQAIAQNPGFAEAYCNRGNVLSGLKRPAEALASFDQAIALNSNFAEAYWNKSLLKLLLGEYEEGWALYEWRWKTDTWKEFVRNFPKPLWLGKESLLDKTILLYPEQGLGDSIQFSRYVPMVEALGAKVVLVAHQPLVGLISTLNDSIRVIPRGNPFPEFDCHCPLMSLPLAFNTTVNTIPAKIFYLSADPNKLKHWQKNWGRNQNYE